MPSSDRHARPLIALLGATASGKTAAAVHLARVLPVEVVSADSRQVRRDMLIGTAAPTADELSAVPHHLVGIIAPDEPWTVTDFLAHARQSLADIWDRGRVPLLTAGTGQYAWALLEGWEVPAVPPDPALRAELEAALATAGVAALQARLAALDPASARRIDRMNPRRLLRAIEIVTSTGLPIPALRRVEPEFSWRAFGLAWPRHVLDARADARVVRMFADGLVAEARWLAERYGPNIEALRTIGYAEAWRVVRGEWDEVTAIAATQRATRRLIRAQGRWFRSTDERIAWRDGADLDALAADVAATLDEWDGLGRGDRLARCT